MENSTLYLLGYDHTGVIFWGYDYFKGTHLIPRSVDLDMYPELKTGTQISGYLYDWLAKNKPEDLKMIKDWVHHKYKGRFGITNGAYSDLFGTVTNGETIIKNFFYGKKTIKDRLGYEVDFFATQEPTLFAQLPQILTGFGYKGAILRLQMGENGIAPEMTASTIWWQGPDDSQIFAVPAYKGMGMKSLDYGLGPLAKSYPVEVSLPTEGQIKSINEDGLHLLFLDLRILYKLTARMPIFEEEKIDNLKKKLSPILKSLNNMINKGEINNKDRKWLLFSLNELRPLVEKMMRALPYQKRGSAHLVDSYQGLHQKGKNDYFLFTGFYDAAVNLTRFICRDIRGNPRDFNWKWLILEDIPRHFPQPEVVFKPEVNDFKVRLRWGAFDGNEIPNLSRKGELEILTAERIASLASVFRVTDWDKEIEEAWKKVLIAQHHDNLICPHKSDVEDVRGFIKDSVKISRRIIDKSMKNLLSQVETRNEDRTLLVMNPTRFCHRFLLKIEIDEDVSIWSGKEPVPSQQIEGGVAFYCDLPSLGYRTFSIRRGRRIVPKSNMRVDKEKREIETKYYRIRFGQSGGIVNLYSKELQREILKSGAVSNRFRSFINRVKIFSRGKITFAIISSHFCVVKEKGEIGNIPYENYITIYNELERIDFKVNFHFSGDCIGKGDNHDDECKLGVLFKGKDAKSRATVDRPFIITEGEHINSHSGMTSVYWCDFSNSESGFSLFHKGTACFRKKGNELFMPLVYSLPHLQFKSGISGTHTYEYALFAHRGDWKKTGLIEEAAVYNFEPRWAIGNPQGGVAPSEFSFLSIEADNVALSSLYRYQGDLYLRLWEYKGEIGKVNLVPSFPLAVKRVNFHHENPENLGMPFTIAPHQIMTLRLDLEEH